MLTSTADETAASDPVSPAARQPRPAYRPFRASVVAVRELSPHFTRVTFTGPDFATFGTAGLDQRINLIFPLPGVGISDCGWDDAETLVDGAWYARWRALPNELRNPLRVYTVRAIRPQSLELDVDFVVHGDGPAARWLAVAAPGDEIVVIGPDAVSPPSTAGIDFHPGDAHSLLLVGDATAAPAIAAILESLPADRVAHAIIEVPEAEDALDLVHSAAATVRWIPRDGGAPGSRLLPAVRAWVADRHDIVDTTLASSAQFVAEPTGPDDLVWDVPEAPTGAGLYAWIAGEAEAITGIRRYLVREVGIDRGQIAFMGYWRNGRTTV
ncbi:NADPH-dependent ferric siderophore reductase [Conyzicola lurida]|uniref:NADPH-dependent ferric siderophore reductase n=1 Tax=Conyzicola lurida TaxID=1172621 RepID=A0A841AGH1_9MICO|nr:siderophore-interacting protein [Conyzicola lurida]MBB5842920.1 NADPH-dependent ferric siderophore reductase [Conyzicola lurida]